MMLHPTQELEPPPNPARFSAHPVLLCDRRRDRGRTDGRRQLHIGATQPCRRGQSLDRGGNDGGGMAGRTVSRLRRAQDHLRPAAAAPVPPHPRPGGVLGAVPRSGRLGPAAVQIVDDDSMGMVGPCSARCGWSGGRSGWTCGNTVRSSAGHRRSTATKLAARIPASTSAATDSPAPAPAPIQPASGYVTSQQACENASCAAKTAPRSASRAERLMKRPMDVRVSEKPKPMDGSRGDQACQVKQPTSPEQRPADQLRPRTGRSCG